MYKLTFYVPESHLQSVKQRLFECGAGRVGCYDCCCWQAKGVGQFRPLDGSKPFVGEKSKVQTEEEWLVEMVCEKKLLKKVLAELIKVHPYEAPAYQYWKINE